jgi:hypothetical protein
MDFRHAAENHWIAFISLKQRSKKKGEKVLRSEEFA